MTHFDDQYDKPLILNFADDPVITDLVSPVCAVNISLHRRAQLPGIWVSSETMGKVVDNALGRLPV